MEELKKILKFEASHIERKLVELQRLKALDLTKFDGKRQNAYLEKALGLKKNERGQFVWSDDDRWLSLSKNNGYYLENETLTFYANKEGYFDALPPFSAEKFKAEVDKLISYCTKDIVKLQLDIKNLDKIAKKLQKMAVELNNYKDSINYMVRKKLVKKLFIRGGL